MLWQSGPPRSMLYSRYNNASVMYEGNLVMFNSGHTRFAPKFPAHEHHLDYILLPIFLFFFFIAISLRPLFDSGLTCGVLYVCVCVCVVYHHMLTHSVSMTMICLLFFCTIIHWGDNILSLVLISSSC